MPEHVSEAITARDHEIDTNGACSSIAFIRSATKKGHTSFDAYNCGSLLLLTQGAFPSN
jgi:hypothetical protein